MCATWKWAKKWYFVKSDLKCAAWFKWSKN